MRQLLTVIAIVGVLGGGIYLWKFKKSEVMSLADSARGYPAATTPREALDYFRSAVKDRDYETAAKYCGGDYAELMRKAAPGATKLGKEIDNLLGMMENKDMNSPKVRNVLDLFEPFPTGLDVLRIEQKGDSEAVAVLTPKVTAKAVDPSANYTDWTIDPLMVRPLGQVSETVGLKKDGKDKAWKIYFTPLMVNGINVVEVRVNRLNDQYKDYYKTFDTLKSQLRNEPMTKDDFEGRVKTELSKLAKGS